MNLATDFARIEDPETLPPPLRCGCGKDWHFTWYVPRVNGRVYSGRWAAPRVDPCELCEVPPAMVAESELRRRVLAAGVPDPLVTFSLDALVEQGQIEPLDSFRTRVRNLQRQAPVLGVTVGQRQAYRELRAWRPPQWLLIHGPPGTGKTSMLAALARRLLTEQPERWEERCGRRTLVRTKPCWVEYHRVDDLVDRERVKLRGLDDAPTRDVALVGARWEHHGERSVRTFDRSAVLMLDELGTAPRPKDAEVKAIERIVGFRADEGLCTVIVTNRDREELVGRDAIYGRRVADRLRGALNVAMTGESWREG